MFGPGSDTDELKDLTKLLQRYRNADGSIDPDMAPPDMKDLLQRLQEEQQKATARRASAGITVVPEPGFVVKTVDSAARKVFLNMCSSPQVATPTGFEQGQMTDKMMEALKNVEHDEEATELLRFPLSLGDFREDVDKKGESCHVLDVVFNADVLKQAQAFRPLKVFLVELAMAWAARKHALELDLAYKLPKMRYKGDAVQPQTLRLDRGPLVKEMGEVPEPPSFALRTEPKRSQPAAPSTSSSQQGQTGQHAQEAKPPPAPALSQPAEAGAAAPAQQVPEGAKGAARTNSCGAAASRQPDSEPAAGTSADADAAGQADKAKVEAEAAAAAPSTSAPLPWQQQQAAAAAPRQPLPELAHRVQFLGRPVEAVEVEVRLAHNSSAEEVSVEVSRDQVFVRAPGHAELALTLPFGVDAALGLAQLLEGGLLRLHMPFKPYRSLVEEASLGVLDSRLFLDSPLMQLDA